MKQAKENNVEEIIYLEFEYKNNKYRFTDGKLECKKNPNSNRYSTLFNITLPKNSKFTNDYAMMSTLCKLCVDSYLQGIDTGKKEKVQEIKTALNLK